MIPAIGPIPFQRPLSESFSSSSRTSASPSRQGRLGGANTRSILAQSRTEFAGRLASTPWYDESSGGRGYFHWAVAGSVGTPDGTGPNNQARYRTRPEARSSGRWIDTGAIDGADINSLLGLEAVYNYGPLQLTGEFMAVNVDRAAGFGPNVQFHGGYVQAGYFLTGEHMPWDRKTGCLARIKSL